MLYFQKKEGCGVRLSIVLFLFGILLIFLGLEIIVDHITFTNFLNSSLCGSGSIQAPITHCAGCFYVITGAIFGIVSILRVQKWKPISNILLQFKSSEVGFISRAG